MKVIILAGGFGTRISEESDNKPKPMIEIGGKPILWHIMKMYSSYGFNDFVVCCGYKGYVIKDYFHHYYMHQADMTVDLGSNITEFHNSSSEPWRITLIDTGLETMTGGRIKRVEPYIGNEPFMLTYGDGVSDVNIEALVDFHRKSGRLATLTAVQPSGKFGALEICPDDAITSFQEKPRGDGAWINGGFFVCQPKVFNYITTGDSTVWERGPLESLAKEGQLGAYKHDGFWQPMDMLRDKIDLEKLWASGKAPWKRWA
ncbi:MAG: glucose-1-phosphate cytidylyltransferase [Rectinemataceae bacterium]|nr:glucose-1-phosphate cytidylyltransferase [Rectinemataceae bacterium]